MRPAILLLALLTAVPCAHAASAHPTAPATTAAEVIQRNVAARGGLEAWRKVQTLVWLGHVERGDRADGPRSPFAMHLQRPNKTRFELKDQYSQFTRIFDGTHGWKVRPGTDGRPQVQPFSPNEAGYSRSEYAIDTPLMDYMAKGVSAELDGIDSVEGHKAYRLSLKLPDGGERKVWIDLQSNLELRYDRPATTPLAPGKPVITYYRNYQAVEGLQIPMVIETGVDPARGPQAKPDRLVIERVLVNPPLDPQTFLPPAMPLRRGNPKIAVPASGPLMGPPGGGP